MVFASIIAQAGVFLSSLAGAEVVKLTTDNFDSFLKENPKTLVKFFAPWCGHCKSLAPHYEEASDKLPEGVKLAEVDATEETALGQRFGVRGYPTIKWFDNGNEMEYDGGRTTDTILSWIETMTTDPITVFETVAAAREVNTDYIIVNSAPEGSAESKVFDELASNNRSAGKFIRVTGEHKDSTAGEIAVYREGETTPTKMAITGVEMDALVKFVKFEKMPLFGNVNQQTFSMYLETGREFIWVAGSEEDKPGLAPVMEAFAKKYQDKYNVVYMDLVESAKQVEGMIGTDTYPVLALMNEGGEGRFILHKEDFTVEKIEAFVDKVHAGEAEPWMKSEPVPESNDGPVKTAVALNFREIMQKEKDVFLKVYAPWCGHCKKMAPDYITVGEEIAKTGSDIVIAEIDGTANEIDKRSFPFTGFPTIFWKKANTMPTPYTGGRDVESMMTFMKENATTPFEWTGGASEESKEKDEL